MEIPYTVTARPDTGLWNAKLGIWLFLASEVMLFGGLFSSYVYLRVGADFPWPRHELPIGPGLTNTFVLIASSVTVVMAWASLKMRKYRSYQLYMLFTILCAGAFMVIKSREYYSKFTHYSVKLTDGSMVDGHKPHEGKFDEVEFGDIKSVTLNFDTSDADFLKDVVGGGTPRFKNMVGEVVEITNEYIAARKTIWRKAQRENNKAIPGTETLTVEGTPFTISVRRKHLSGWSDAEMIYRDGTRLAGKLIDDTIRLEVSGWDMRQMKNLGKDETDDLKSTEGALAWTYLPHEKEKFLKHRDEKLEEWKKASWIVSRNEDRAKDGIAPLRPLEDSDLMYDAFTSVHMNAHADGHEAHHETVAFKRSDIKFFSNYSPRLNTYYAIYFMMTGLHGLHVIGGALVLAYFLFFNKSLYEKNPEHLCNRVEVGGLFWHFVDLVWIFLFPLYYLL